MDKLLRHLLQLIGSICAAISVIDAHGLLLDPTSRSSLWRFGYNAPTNYDDNQLFCGGFNVQYIQNGGKCGICGDDYAQPNPRDNELHGLYDIGAITRRYKAGDVITAQVQLTANHMGWFEFRTCAYKNGQNTEVSQECLDGNLLQLADGSGTRFIIPSDSQSYVTFNIKLKLPAGFTCQHCLFQWHYNTGNSWGRCSDGSEEIGCGPQETFRGCADISIA